MSTQSFFPGSLSSWSLRRGGFARRLVTRSRAASPLALDGAAPHSCLGRVSEAGPGCEKCGRGARDAATEPPVLAGPLGALPGAGTPAGSRGLRAAAGDGLPAGPRRDGPLGQLDAGLQQGAAALLRRAVPGVPALLPGHVRPLVLRRPERLRRPGPAVPGPREGHAGRLRRTDPLPVGTGGAPADAPEGAGLPDQPAEHGGARPAVLRGLGLLPVGGAPLLAEERAPRRGRSGRAGALQQRRLDVPGPADPARRAPAGRPLQLPSGARQPQGAHHPGLGARPAPAAPSHRGRGGGGARRRPDCPAGGGRLLEEARPRRLPPHPGRDLPCRVNLTLPELPSPPLHKRLQSTPQPPGGSHSQSRIGGHWSGVCRSPSPSPSPVLACRSKPFVRVSPPFFKPFLAPAAFVFKKSITVTKIK